MKITIKKWNIEINKSRIILFLSPIIYMWNVWQHEIMMKTTLNYELYPILSAQQTFLDWAWKQPFAFFSGIQTSFGIGYDLTLLGQAIAYLMLFALVIYRGRKKPEPTTP